MGNKRYDFYYLVQVHIPGQNQRHVRALTCFFQTVRGSTIIIILSNNISNVFLAPKYASHNFIMANRIISTLLGYIKPTLSLKIVRYLIFFVFLT